MNTYKIENTHSGVILGHYQGTTAADALDALAKDAGYPDYAGLSAEVPAKAGAILVTEVSPE